LFDRYSQKIYRFSLSYLKSDAEAEEIVQEVFMKLWENRGKLKSDKSFKSYLFTIAFNAIKKKFNQKMKNEKYKHDLFQWLNEEKPSLESRLDFETLLEKLDLLIGQLPGKRKAIFLQRKKEGKSIQDIAAEMGISPKTVKNQITEAMNFLKESFANDDVSAMLFYFLFIS
jgi:RNA polymerase sigma-70 factor (ECF subfamily)